MRGKDVALVAEAADPHLVDGGEINDRKRIDHGSATTASERRVRQQRRGLGERLQRRVDGRDRDGAVRSVSFSAGKDVPRHPHGVLQFQVVKFRHSSGSAAAERSFRRRDAVAGGCRYLSNSASRCSEYMEINLI